MFIGNFWLVGHWLFGVVVIGEFPFAKIWDDLDNSGARLWWKLFEFGRLHQMVDDEGGFNLAGEDAGLDKHLQ